MGGIAVSGKDESSILKVSTNDLPERERCPLLRDFYRRGEVKAELDANEGEPIVATLTGYALPEAHLLTGCWLEPDWFERRN